MVVQNLHIDHECEQSFNLTSETIPDHLGNQSYKFSPYGTSPLTRSIFLVTEITFITVIIVGNLLIVITIWSKSNLRTPGFMYIFSVAISHFLIGVVVIPMYIIGHMPNQHLTSVQCKIVEYISSLASAASPYSAVALATHRFRERMYIVHSEITYKQFIIDSSIVWGFSILYASKAIVLYDMVVEVIIEKDILHCVSMCEVPHSLQELSNWFMIFDFILLYIVPLVLMLTLYIIVGIKIWTSTVDTDANEVQNRDSLTSTIIFILIVFFLCFLGIYCWNMYVYWGPGHFENSLLWREILKMISFITGWSNVFLILCFNRTFTKNLVKRKKRNKPRTLETGHYLSSQSTQEGINGISRRTLTGGNNHNAYPGNGDVLSTILNSVDLNKGVPSGSIQSDNISEYDNVS